MTCIIGYIDNKNNIWMAGDSAIAEPDAYREFVTPEKKVYISGNWLIGDAGSVVVAQIVKHSLKLPKYTKDMDIYKYMSTKFNKALRDVLREYGQLSKGQENELESMEGNFLLGVKTKKGPKLFELDNDFSVLELSGKFHAIGSARDLALGAMSAMESINDSKLKPEERLRIALESSERFSAFVRKPFVIEKI